MIVSNMQGRDHTNLYILISYAIKLFKCSYQAPLLFKEEVADFFIQIVVPN